MEEDEAESGEAVNEPKVVEMMLLVDERDCDALDETKVSAEEGEGVGGESGIRADNADNTADAASVDTGLLVDENAVNRDPVGAEPVNVSMVDEDAAAVKPVDESVPAGGAEVDW